MSAEVKQRKPRATTEEQIQTLFTKLSKVMARKAKADNKAKGDVIEDDGPGPKKDVLKACDDIIESVKNLKKAIRRI